MGSIVYVVLAVIVAIFGRKRVLRFWGTLLLGLVFTPIVSALVLLLGAPVEDRRKHAI